MATGISLGIVYLAVAYGMRGIYSYDFYFTSYLFRIAVILFSFALWIFLSCLFIPSHKKLAGIIPMVAATLLTLLIVFLDLRNGSSIPFNQNIIIAFSSLYIGLIIGYFMSYLIFKDKGWQRAKNNTRPRELEI